MICLGVEDQHPLKQGLKPQYCYPEPEIVAMVEDQHPLKQGLKLKIIT